MLKKHVFVCCRCFLLLCNISQIATGVLYSESPRKKAQSALILINIGCDLTCFGPVQSFDLLGWGSHILRVLSQITPKKVGSHVLRVLSKVVFCALAPDLFIINLRLPYSNWEYTSNILVIY
jgi:hypothetical protein